MAEEIRMWNCFGCGHRQKTPVNATSCKCEKCGMKMIPFVQHIEVGEELHQKKKKNVWQCRDGACRTAFMVPANMSAEVVRCPACGSRSVRGEKISQSPVSDSIGRGEMLDLGFGLLLEAQS